MVNYIAKIEPATIRVSPYGFFMFAEDYFRVAELAIKLNFGKRINYPAYFLYTRSFELVIKAILLASDIVKIDEFKSYYKHDLDKLIKKLSVEIKSTLSLSKKDEEILLFLNQWYKTCEKKFEYFDLLTSGIVNIKETKYCELPKLEALSSIGEKIINGEVKKYILDRAQVKKDL